MDRRKAMEKDVRICLVNVKIDENTWEGTGFFISTDVILTSGHVVAGAKKATIIVSSGETYQGEVRVDYHQ
jgi:S1-C subfamily serine protease